MYCADRYRRFSSFMEMVHDITLTKVSLRMVLAGVSHSVSNFGSQALGMWRKYFISCCPLCRMALLITQIYRIKYPVFFFFYLFVKTKLFWYSLMEINCSWITGKELVRWISWIMSSVCCADCWISASLPGACIKTSTEERNALAQKQCQL